MSKNILVLNTGSTSTKIAIYRDREQRVLEEYRHSKEELDCFAFMGDQAPMRAACLHDFIQTKSEGYQPFTAIVARGGLLPPVQAGGYAINDNMCDFLENVCTQEHASNLAAFIALPIAREYGIPHAYIYDAVSTDEMEPLARLTGLREVPRVSMVHALNSRAVAHRYAEESCRTYSELDVIVVHLGGGISLSLHKQGRMVDIVRDDEGPFSPERAGRLQTIELVKYLDQKTLTLKEQIKLLRGGSGFKSLLGTNDAREVDARMAAGDEEAQLVLQALAYQVTKAIGELAAAASGRVDAILLTGGMAHSQTLVGMVCQRVEFLAPVRVYPGENEMESLAHGALRILEGKESVREFCYQDLMGADKR